MYTLLYQLITKQATTHYSTHALHSPTHTSMGGATLKAWPPQNFEIFLNIYIIILMFSKFSLQK